MAHRKPLGQIFSWLTDLVHNNPGRFSRPRSAQRSKWFAADIELTPNRHIVHSVSERWSPSLNIPPAASHAALVHPPFAGLLSSNALIPSSFKHAAASLQGLRHSMSALDRCAAVSHVVFVQARCFLTYFTSNLTNARFRWMIFDEL